MDQVELSMLVDIGLKFYAVPSQPTLVTMRSMSLVVELIDLVTKHKSGELRCPATALIGVMPLLKQNLKILCARYLKKYLS